MPVVKWEIFLSVTVFPHLSFFFGALTTLTLPPPSSPPSSLLIRSLGCDVDVGPVSSSLMEPLCLPLSPPPQLERVNNSQASYYKDKAYFFSFPLLLRNKPGTYTQREGKKKKDSVKNAADKFIRTHRKANSINVLTKSHSCCCMERKRKIREERVGA